MSGPSPLAEVCKTQALSPPSLGYAETFPCLSIQPSPLQTRPLLSCLLLAAWGGFTVAVPSSKLPFLLGLVVEPLKQLPAYHPSAFQSCLQGLLEVAVVNL